MFWQISLKAELKAREELAGTAQLSVKLELQLLATSSSLKNVFFSLFMINSRCIKSPYDFLLWCR